MTPSETPSWPTTAEPTPEEFDEPVPVPTMTIVAGDNQSATLVMTEHGFAMATFAPVAALLRDAEGKPMAGEVVTWSIAETPGQMGVQLDPNGTSPCYVTTDEEGISTLQNHHGNSAKAFYAPGLLPLVASQGAAHAPAHLVVEEPLELRPRIVGGDNQSVPATGGTARFAPMKVLVKDVEGTPVAGVELSYEAVGPKGMVIQMQPSGPGTVVVTSDDAGMATLDLVDGASLVCTGAIGTFKVVVTAPATKPIIFHHTVETEAPEAAP
ncbi:MAG: hypothetical protein NVSMB32_07130 [Actinomycetota bacterium]